MSCAASRSTSALTSTCMLNQADENFDMQDATGTLEPDAKRLKPMQPTSYEEAAEPASGVDAGMTAPMDDEDDGAAAEDEDVCEICGVETWIEGNWLVRTDAQAAGLACAAPPLLCRAERTRWRARTGTRRCAILLLAARWVSPLRESLAACTACPCVAHALRAHPPCTRPLCSFAALVPPPAPVRWRRVRQGVPHALPHASARCGP